MFLCFISCMSAREEDTLKKFTKTTKKIREKVPKSLKFYLFLIFRFGWGCWRSWRGQTTRINAWHYPNFRTVWYCSPCQRWYFVYMIFQIFWEKICFLMWFLFLLGYIMMFIFMPAVFPDDFTMYIGQIISPILRALADENEFVRYKRYSN